jgi:sulfopropanediol 3-dehydrogenase
MQFSAHCTAVHRGSYRVLKAPAHSGPPAQRDPAVVSRVSEMLQAIERDGIDAVARFANELDSQTTAGFELEPSTVARSGDELEPALRQSLEVGAERTQKFAAEQRNRLTDFDIELAPGLRAGYRYVPVTRVGAYLPAGRFPILASAFMTVGVAKTAGVPTVLACTPPQPDGRPDAAVLYATYLSGADRVFVLGGVQALAAMAFGLLGEPPIDMLVGAGNAYVAEAKRQLFGRIAIDLRRHSRPGARCR